MLNLGTVKPGSTIRIPFTSFDKDDGSAITMTNYAAADILVYKDGSTTERASTAGYTATTDFDAKTGKHLAVIDLSDNTTADFWAAGSEYLVAIDSVTIDAVTTGGWVARFLIGYPGANLDTTIATLASQTSFTLTNGPAQDDALNGHYAIIHAAASAVQRTSVLILDYTGSTKTVTLAAGGVYTVAAKDNISVMDLAPLQPATLGRTLVVSSGGVADANAAQIAADATSATNLKTAFNDTAGAVPWMGLVDQGTAQAATGTTLQLRSAAAFADDELIGAIIVITGGTTGVGQARVITDYVGSTDTATVDTWTTTPTGTITYKIWAAPPISATLVPAVNVTQFGGVNGTFASGRPEVNTSHAAGTAWNSGAIGASTLAADTITAAKIAADAIGASELAADAVTEIQSGLSTLTAAGVRTAVGLASANLDTQLGAIDDFVDTEVAAIKAVTDKLDNTLENTSDGWIFSVNALQQAPSGTGASAVAIADEVQTRTIAAVTTVNGLAANSVNASALASDAVTEIQSGLATSSALSTVDSNVTAIKAKTDNLPSDPADASVVAGLIAGVDAKVDILDTNVDSILDDTGTSGVVVAAASKTGYRLSSTGVDDLLRTALTEGYAADGSTFTLEQGMYMVWALLAERGIASTTLTAKKLDGSTTAMTFTLDDGTSPTSQTRAT